MILPQQKPLARSGERHREDCAHDEVFHSRLLGASDSATGIFLQGCEGRQAQSWPRLARACENHGLLALRPR
jgi:hypothetical protein